jgi:hypothetical protein
VKYAQCVKIWLFLKSCVQFLMNTILILVIDEFLMKKKGSLMFSLHTWHAAQEASRVAQVVFNL